MSKHLHSFRKGWQNEHLARYILSKFSFVAEPSNISDDLGSDFFCTLFKIKIQDKNYLNSKNSFAIQIKSNKNTIDITNKINYLETLEVPFFIGVVDRNKLKLVIYSGESIIHFITKIGSKNKKVNIKLLDSREDAHFFLKIRDDEYTLKFPKLIEISANFDYEEKPDELDEIFTICDLIHENISSRKNKEYIYKISNGYQYKNDIISIYAGKDSFNSYEENFIKRLAEAFFNLEWSYDNQLFDQNQFKMYEKIYYLFEEHYKLENKRLPIYLTEIFNKLKDKLPS
jgi:hypothetical protein